MLDVGSRLGAAVYAAVLLGGCKSAVGVEMNEDLCGVQQEAISLFGLAKRGARIVCADIMTRPDEVAAADVVLLHSAFQFFQTAEQSRAIWDFLRGKVPPPSLPPVHRRPPALCAAYQWSSESERERERERERETPFVLRINGAHNQSSQSKAVLLPS